jgi:hypothetical protein
MSIESDRREIIRRAWSDQCPEDHAAVVWLAILQVVALVSLSLLVLIAAARQ